MTVMSHHLCQPVSTIEPERLRRPGDRCSDFDEDCAEIAASGTTALLHCWKYDAVKGVCPYLSGDLK